MATIRIGNNEPVNLYVGEDTVQRIYRGSQQVWPAATLTIIGSIPTQNLAIGSGTVTIDLRTIFSGVNLSYSIEPISAPVTVDNDSLEINTIVAYSNTTIEVTATDGQDSVSVQFDLEIAPIPNQVIDFGTSGDQGHFRKTFSEPFITDTELTTYSPINPADPTSLSVTTNGLAFATWWNGNGAGGTALGGIAEDGDDYVTFTTSQIQHRREATQETVSAGPVADTFGWHFISGSVRRRADNGNAVLTHQRDGGAVVVGTAGGRATHRIPFMNQLAIGRLSAVAGGYTTGVVFDFAVMRGNPAAAHAWCWNDGVNFRSLEQYDFASDPDCKLIALYRMKRINPQTNNDATGADIENIIKIGDPRAGDFTPLPDTPFVEESNVVWADQAPWAIQGRLVVTIEPSIAETGGVFTVNDGTYNAIPAVTIERTAFWNGIEVSLANDTFTRPTGETGQFTCYWKISNSEKTFEFVKADDTYLPNLRAGSGDDLSVSWSTNGIYHDGQLVRWPNESAKEAFYWRTNGVGVVGALTAVSHYPPPANARNGAQINVTHERAINPTGIAGGAGSYYSAAKNAEIDGPFSVSVGDVVLFGRSNWNRQSGGEAQLGFITMHCVNTKPYWDAFRPSFIGSATQRAIIHRQSDISPAAVPSLSTAGMSAGFPSSFSALLRRPALEIQTNAQRTQTFFDNGDAHIVAYGDNRYAALRNAYLLSCGNTLTLQEKLDGPLGYVIQYGIDTGYGLYESWQRTGQRVMYTDGAWNYGTETPIAVVAQLFDVSALKTMVGPSGNFFQDSEVTFYITEEILTETNKPLYPTAGVSYRNRSGQPDQNDFWYPYRRSTGVNVNQYEAFQAGQYNGGVYPMADMLRDIGSNWPHDANAYWRNHQYQAQNDNNRDADVVMRLGFNLGPLLRDNGWLDFHLRAVRVKQGQTDPWIDRGGLTPNSYTAVAGTPSPNNTLDNSSIIQFRRLHWPDADLYPWNPVSSVHRSV